MNLAQLRGLAWGMDDAAVGQAVSRFGKRRLKEPKLRRQMAHEITIVKCCELPRMALRPKWPSNENKGKKTQLHCTSPFVVPDP